MQNAELLGFDGMPLPTFFLESWDIDESGLLFVHTEGGRLFNVDTGDRNHGFDAEGTCGIIEFIRAEDDPEDIYSMTFVFDVLTRHAETCGDVQEAMLWRMIHETNDPKKLARLHDRLDTVAAANKRQPEEEYEATHESNGGT